MLCGPGDVQTAEVSGGAHLIDDDCHIGGDGTGRWYVVLCPAGAQNELANDLRVQEAEGKKLLRHRMYRKKANPDPDQIDTSEI